MIAWYQICLDILVSYLDRKSDHVTGLSFMYWNVNARYVRIMRSLEIPKTILHTNFMKFYFWISNLIKFFGLMTSIVANWIWYYRFKFVMDIEWVVHVWSKHLTTYQTISGSYGACVITYSFGVFYDIFMMDNLSTSIPTLEEVFKWKHFPCYWPFVRGIHWSPVNSPHKGQWRRALMFSLICTWINA